MDAGWRVHPVAAVAPIGGMTMLKQNVFAIKFAKLYPLTTVRFRNPVKTGDRWGWVIRMQAAVEKAPGKRVFFQTA